MATKNQEASIKSLERQIGQISKQISIEKPSSPLPSDTIPNPKEEYKAIQLRSGRTLMSNNDTTKKQTESIKEPTEDEKQTKADQAKEQVVVPNKNTEKLKEQDNQSHSSKEMTQGQQHIGKSITPPLPYPQRFNKEVKDQYFHKFLETFKKLEINIPLAEALEQMPLALIQKGLPPKLEDPGSFLLPCTIGELTITKAMCDLGASINLIPSSLVKKLHIKEVKPVQMSLELVDKSIVHPRGVVENLLVKVDSFIYPADFVVLESDKDDGDSVILGRPFLATARAIIDIEKGELTLRMHDQSVTLKALPEAQFSEKKKDCMEIDKGGPQLKEKNGKESPSNTPRPRIVPINEEAQEDIGILATEKRGN
ncbi:uncharacterized protein LOC130975156 [Arachis stenosperma]|uniref:uncharacterized protein LOC130975156 n=1 Tax=Arachis stenosperma TaxID=217475 RepID=UPI0025ABB261|nr:uncharacterized protein LOC130975156 [Arachis stenosperma]